MATRGHLVVPTSKAESSQVIKDVRGQLTYVFGGVSMYVGDGAWDANEDDETTIMDVVKEPHVRFVITGEDDGQVREEMRENARYVKKELDEDAVLVEFEDVEMELV